MKNIDSGSDGGRRIVIYILYLNLLNDLKINPQYEPLTKRPETWSLCSAYIQKTSSLSLNSSIFMKFSHIYVGSYLLKLTWEISFLPESGLATEPFEKLLFIYLNTWNVVAFRQLFAYINFENIFYFLRSESGRWSSFARYVKPIWLFGKFVFPYRLN